METSQLDHIHPPPGSYHYYFLFGFQFFCGDDLLHRPEHPCYNNPPQTNFLPVQNPNLGIYGPFISSAACGSDLSGKMLNPLLPSFVLSALLLPFSSVQVFILFILPTFFKCVGYRVAAENMNGRRNISHHFNGFIPRKHL